MNAATLLAAALTVVPLDHHPGPLERGDGGPPALLVPGRALLKLHGIDGSRLELARADDADAAGALDALGKRVDVDMTLVRAVVLGWALVEVRFPGDARMPTEAETSTLIARIAQDPAVAGASAEHWWRALALPNDPGIAQMWHLDAVDAAEAWDVTQGTSGQRIGVVDTGILRSHEDLAGRAVRGFDFISSSSAANDGNGRDADFNDAGDGCGSPSSFHGTHVAGTIGAAANNAKGIAGLNWNAGLVIARVLGRCGGSSVDIMEGAAWLAGASVAGVPAIGADKVSVMNLSLGGPNACSSFEQQVVDFVDAQGAMFVAAAGNDGGAVGSPANCGKVITVASHGPGGSLTGYSSFGSSVEIVAPGGDFSFGQAGGVLSSIGPNNASYAFLEGTSMAAPHVAGVVSLVQALAPTISRANLVAALQSQGVACGGCDGKVMLNARTALAAVGGSSAGTPPPPAPPPPAALDDAFEENDALAQATTAQCGVNDASLIALPADRDFYSLVPPAGRRIAIAIQATNGADLDLYVTNASGSILARSESPTGTERITGTASGARLGILVNPFVDTGSGQQHTGPYRLTITCSSTVSTQSVDELDGEFEAGDGDDVVDGDVGTGELGLPETAPDEEPIEEPGAPGADGDGADIDDSELDDDGDDGLRIAVPSQPRVSGGCSSTSTASLPLLACGALLILCARRRRR